MIDDAVKRYLNRVYNCKIVKVGTHRTMIKSQRRKKLGVKYKILGIFPIYEYEEWEEYLYNWETISLEQYSGIIRIPDIDIAVCVDDFNNIVYWKYCE